jgi:hypothetical protein
MFKSWASILVDAMTALKEESPIAAKAPKK